MTALLAEGLDGNDISRFGYRSERWNFVEGEAMSGIIAKLNKEQNRYIISTVTSRVVWKTLVFYPGATLVRVTDLSWRPDGLTLFFFGLRGQYRRLDGSRRFIQYLNEKVPLKLNAGNVADYLRFYSFFVHSGGRPFLLAETTDDLGLFSAPLTDGQKNKITQSLKPVTLQGEDPEQGFIVTATVRYADSLFDCEFNVTPGGLVKMVRDKQIEADLPELSGELLAPAWG